MGPPRGPTDDLATLGELNDGILLEELEQRYRKDLIYTYIGDILVSVNPYKLLLSFYGDEIGHRYGKAKTLGELKPHVYALGSRAYHNVQRGQGSQCLLVSGESGAGKTEITKIIVAQIARLSQWEGEHFLQDKIVEVNPLLEAFGNASTTINNNSSRFGKLIELIFSDHGVMLGARITEHMLEKSRVVRQSQGEKNFHIFYNVMCGFTADERKRYFLDVPERYRIVDPGHGAPVIATEIDHAGYKESMNNLRRIMPIVGFTNQDMDVIFALLAAILHLCNIEMAVEPESDEVMVMNEEEIDFAAILLSLKAEDLITVLMSNVNWVRGERIVNIKTLDQAVDGRDAMAKALYSRLFSWIVQQVNFMLHEDEQREGERSIISILDMAGFENFQYNSLEQLCINAANERLQHFFNEHIFSLELQEYQTEGIKQPKIKFSNNTELLNLLFQRPMGLLSLLEEECLLAKTTEMTFIDKVNKQFVKQDLYRKSKLREPVFGIQHYAGMVSYNASGFLVKNRDTLSSNMQSLMENSQNNLVNELFTATVLNTGTLEMRNGSGKSKWKKPEFQQPQKRQYSPGDSLSRQAGRKIRQKMKDQETFQDIPVTQNPTSATAHFKNSLQLLMDRLKGSEAHFVRCIKPNNFKKPNSFEPKVVLDQLKSTGVLETTKIRRLGYAVRLPFAVFIQRYQFLAFPITAYIEPCARSCSEILQCANLTDVLIGNTKVFLKYWQCDYLNARMDGQLTNIIQIQSQLRTYLARQKFLYQARVMKQDAADIQLLGNYTHDCGDAVYKLLQTQNDNDVARATRSPRRMTNGNHDDSYNINGNHRDTERVEMRMSDVFSPHVPTADRHTQGSEGFYKYITSQLLDKIHELDPDVWCKLFYMEYDRPVAKFYLCDKDVIVDGSYDDFTGKKIGLGVFKNPQRTEATENIRKFIGKGIRLNKEPDGSITATRLGKNNVFVKGYEDPANHCLSAEVIKCEGMLPSNQPVKIFDMEEYKSHIGIALRSGSVERETLEILSISCLSLIQDDKDDLQTPCWLCIINKVALDALHDPDIKREMQQKIVELSLRDAGDVEDQQKLRDMVDRHERNWSKMNPRQAGHGKKEPLRKSRIQIKQKGEKVQDIMDYSWEEKSSERKMNITDLQEEYDRFDENESVFGGVPNSGRPGRHASVASSMAFSGLDGAKPARKDWAKIKNTIKQENAQDADALQKSKSKPQ